MRFPICLLCILTTTLGWSESVELPLPPSEVEEPVNKLHILYLMQSKEWDRSIELYRRYHKQIGRHDFEILQQMALIVLDQGMHSPDPEQQLISIFGSKIAGIAASIDILEAGITSDHPETQLASIQYIGQIQDDRSEELLTKAMASNFFYTRMEAAHQLAMRKSRSAVGQIEALMYRIPPQARFFFPQFFALIGTSDAITLLRKMMDEPFPLTRIEAILSAARFGRDDLLSAIRAKATHAEISEQEACAAALGTLKDSPSIPTLKKLSSSSHENVKIASLRALYQLGDESVKEELYQLALNENPFAIMALADVPGAQDTLAKLIRSDNLQTRFNAFYSLLVHRDSRALSAMQEFLIRDLRDLAFQPQYSTGNSLISWKVISSATQHQKSANYDIIGVSLNVREYLLQLCLELPEGDLLKVAQLIFQSKQTELIPSLVSILENVQTPAILQLLKEKSQETGAPLIRSYCLLSLFRLKQKGPYEEAILKWIEMKKGIELIRFRPSVPWNIRLPDRNNSFELTPEENSRLLIECYLTFAREHSEKGIDILLEGIRSGHPKNRPVLAGLLIQALQ